MFESKWVSVVGCVLLIGLIILVIVLSFKSVTAEPESIRMVKWLACSACGHYYKGDISNRPAECPKCGVRGVWPAMRCAKCGTIVPIDTFKYDRELREPYCLKCGSGNLERIDSTPVEAPPDKK
ncbi:MAG: hypothetical protein JSV03_16015 [Planctomycetota bacterium]|nr:MAG: hypothetical protein JSV03_16015 [Planctomycetota bacterium]